MKNYNKEPSVLTGAILAIILLSAMIGPLIYTFWDIKKSPKVNNQTSKSASFSQLEKIAQLKNELEASTKVLKENRYNIATVRNELLKKEGDALHVIDHFIFTEYHKRTPLRKKSNNALSTLISSYESLINHESFRINLESLRYTQAYLNELYKIISRIDTAITRSEFVIDKINTDLMVANAIGEDTINKMRSDINGGIKDSLLLSANLGNQNIEPTTSLKDVWKQLCTAFINRQSTP